MAYEGSTLRNFASTGSWSKVQESEGSKGPSSHLPWLHLLESAGQRFVSLHWDKALYMCFPVNCGLLLVDLVHHRGCAKTSFALQLREPTETKHLEGGRLRCFDTQIMMASKFKGPG